MYSELLFFPQALKNQAIYPHQARELVALACDGFPVDPKLFQRDSDRSINPGAESLEDEGLGIPPLVTFGAGQGCVRVIGLGKEGSQLVASQSALIGTAIATHLNNTPYTFKTNSGHCQLDASYSHLYRINSLVISKKLPMINRHKDESDQFTLESVFPLIQRAILNGLISQARLLDLDDGRATREAAIGTDDMLGLAVLSGAPKLGKINRDSRAYALFVNNLVFALNLDLKGPWYAGHLRSRGYGLIRKERL